LRDFLFGNESKSAEIIGSSIDILLVIVSTGGSGTSGAPQGEGGVDEPPTVMPSESHLQVCTKLFEPCLSPNGSSKGLSMFDKLRAALLGLRALDSS